MRHNVTVNNLHTRRTIDSAITCDGATARAMAVYFKTKYPVATGNYVIIATV